MTPAEAMEAGRRGLVLHHPMLGQDRWITYVPPVKLPPASATSPTTAALLVGLGLVQFHESWSVIDMREQAIEAGIGILHLLDPPANDDDWTAEEPAAVRARYSMHPAEQGFLFGPVQVAMIRQSLAGDVAQLGPKALARLQLDRDLVCALLARVEAAAEPKEAP